MANSSNMGMDDKNDFSKYLAGPNSALALYPQSRQCDALLQQ
jgi:hypothetical protein